MKGSIPNKAFYRIDEVADIFDVHQNTVRNWIEEKKLTAIKLPGGHIRVAHGAIFRIIGGRTRRVLSPGIGP